MEKRGWKDGYPVPKSSKSLEVMASWPNYEMSDGAQRRQISALSPCPSELGTHGAVDLPRSAAGLAERSGLQLAGEM
jgi:hypothetical protein